MSNHSICFLQNKQTNIGNISAGKSTLCRDLAAELGYTLFLEPVVTNPYLELYYENPVRYGLDMQLWLLRQRFIMYCRAIKALGQGGDNDVKGVVLDRSLMSDVVFADKVIKKNQLSYLKKIFIAPPPPLSCSPSSSQHNNNSKPYI